MPSPHTLAHESERSVSDQAEEALARAFVPRHLIAELTSRCNLRCRYCQKALPEWNSIPGRDEDLAPAVMDRLFETLNDVRFNTVQLSGIGEFTFRSDWTEVLRRFHGVGVGVTMISNFARPFTDAELAALLELEHLMVSIDTVNADLLKSIRKTVSFATISTNLTRLRMAALKRNKKLPYIRLNAVLYAENLLGIEDLAYFAVEHRVDEMQYERMVAQTDLRPPNELHEASPQTALDALAQLSSARKLLEENSITASFHGDLIQTLEIVAGL